MPVAKLAELVARAHQAIAAREKLDGVARPPGSRRAIALVSLDDGTWMISRDWQAGTAQSYPTIEEAVKEVIRFEVGLAGGRAAALKQAVADSDALAKDLAALLGP